MTDQRSDNIEKQGRTYLARPPRPLRLIIRTYEMANHFTESMRAAEAQVQDPRSKYTSTCTCYRPRTRRAMSVVGRASLRLRPMTRAHGFEYR